MGWQEGTTACGLVLFSLALYVRTLVPGLIPNDSSEFQVLAHTLGHAHTTGYHVYLLLAKLFTLLAPVGDIAYRVNLFSALCASLTVGLVFLCGRVLTGSRWAALVGAFALSIAALFWSQAILAEVYAVGSMFTAAIFLAVLLWYRTGSARYLFAAGLLGGLGVSAHSTNLLFAPAIVLLVLLRGRLRETWKPAVAGAALGAALLVGAFAVIDARLAPSSIMNAVYRPSISRWDMRVEDLDSPLERFTFLIFARQWRSAMFENPGEIMPGHIMRFQTRIVQDFSAPLLALILAGLVAAFALDWKLGLFFLAAVLVHSLYTLNYRIRDIYVFFISLYVPFTILIAHGAAVMLRLFSRLPQRTAGIARPALGILLLVLAAAPFAEARIAGLRMGEARFLVGDVPTNQALEGWHRSVSETVAALPENAIVLMDWYSLYGYFYAAHVEQGKPDMLFIEAHPYAAKPGMADSLFVFLEDEMERGRPVYALSEMKELQRGGFRLSGQTVGGSRMFIVEKR